MSTIGVDSIARCDIWWATTDALAEPRETVLDAGERARADAFVDKSAATRFVLGAALLRLVAGRALDLAPRTVPVDRTCDGCGRQHGRPRIAGYDLCVSVSHSGTAAVVAAAQAASVGVDLELVRTFDFASLLGRVCDVSERAAVRDAPSFFRHWTRKESVLKATGDGLRVPMTDVVLTPANTAPRLLRYKGRPDIATTMADLSFLPGYAAAITVLVDMPITFTVRGASALFRQ